MEIEFLLNSNIFRLSSKSIAESGIASTDLSYSFFLIFSSSDALIFCLIISWIFDWSTSQYPDKKTFISACKFVGFLTETEEEWVSFKKKNVSLSEKEIEEKINQRNEARAKKNYQKADEIRNELLDKGVLIEDKDGKTV